MTSYFPRMTVVGVVADSRLNALDKEVYPEVFWPMAQLPSAGGWVLSCEIFAFRVPTSFNKAEGNIEGRVFASAPRTPRSLRPQAYWETPRARTGRSHRRPCIHGPVREGHEAEV